MEKLRFPKRIYFLFNSIVIFFALFVAVRVAFYIGFFRDSLAGQLASRPEFFEFIQAAVIGLRSDLRLALLLVLPAAILVWLPALNPEREKPAQYWLTYFMTIVTVLSAFYAYDFIFYAQWGQHLDASVFTTPPTLGRNLLETGGGFFVTVILSIFLFKRFAFWELREDLGYQPPYVPNYFIEGAKIIGIISLYAAGVWCYFTPIQFENPVIRFFLSVSF